MAAVARNPATVLADIVLTSTGPASVTATSNLTYSITLTNVGSSTASNLVVSDVLPAGTTFVSASSGGTHNAGIVGWPALTNFVNGARTNYTVTVKAPVGGTLTNIAYATGPTADPDPSNNNGAGTGNRVVTTVTPLADVATAVTGPAGVLATTDYSYAVTVTNSGPSTAAGVVVSSFLPAGARFVGASGGGTHNSGVVTWSLGGLASGAVINLTATVTAPDGGAATNIVVGAATSTDLVPSNNDGSSAGARVVTMVYPFPLLTGQVLPGGRFQMEFDTVPGTTLSILASTNLVDWVTLTTTNSGAGHVVVVVPNIGAFPQRFYRSSQ